MSKKECFNFSSVPILFLSCSGNDDKQRDSGVVNMRIHSYTFKCEIEANGTCQFAQESDDIGSTEWNIFYFSGSIVLSTSLL